MCPDTELGVCGAGRGESVTIGSHMSTRVLLIKAWEWRQKAGHSVFIGFVGV